MALILGSTTVITDERVFVVSSGSVRPSTPSVGMLFFNTSTKILECYTGASWVPRVSTTPPRNAWGWGANSYGQIGDITSSSRSSPVSVGGGFTDWIQISSGYQHTLAVRANGTAWAWGRGNYGRLGIGNTGTYGSPKSIVGGFTNWKQVSAGFRHSGGIRANGTAWCWGRNSYGNLGNGTGGIGISSVSPVSVVGGFTDWKQISCTLSGSHTAAVRANGTLWSWGAGTNGALGDNTASSRNSPVLVVGGFTDWIQVSTGNSNTGAVRANGTIWCWGYGLSGRLGNNNTSNRSSPVSVVGGFTDWIQVSAGNSFMVGLRSNGSLWSWGVNSAGNLGDNSLATSRTSPVSVVGGFVDWVQVSAGNIHAVALRSNGTLWAWGSNSNGRLGDNTTTNRSSPVSVIGGFTDWVQTSAGGLHSLGRRA